ncbi:MAG: flagellar export chaperone FlgN [Treponema sp.]|jgi:hypothetical protein|nr:flagellar export chaperone FlgN [Treponema sp.]
MEKTQALSIILVKEIEVLENIPPLQGMIRNAVIKREWAEYETLMHTVGEIGSRFEALDAEREALFKTMADGEEPDSFYAWAAKLPDNEKDKISTLYRKLKMITLQIRIANDTLMEYLREVKTVIAGVLDRAYPDRRGKMYSRRGTERETDMRSVMVNRSL